MHIRRHRHWMPPSAIFLILLVALDATFATFSLTLLTMSAPTGVPIVIGEAGAAGQLALVSWLVAILTMISLGLYSGENLFGFSVFLRIGIAFALALLFSSVAEFYVRNEFDVCGECAGLPMRITVIWFGWVGLTRGAFATTFRLGFLKRRLLVLGVGGLAARVAEILEDGRNHRFEPVAFVGFPGERAVIGRDRLTWYGSELGSLAEWGPRLGIEEIVVATSECNLPLGQLLECKHAGIKITRFLDFWEHETKSLDLEALHPDWLLFSRGFYCKSADAILKRGVDIIGSLGLLLFTLPLQVVTAGLIRLDSPGPVFYRQERIGLHGKRFLILKYRSMYADAEQGGPRWAATRDPRVTRVGRVIRKLRIDELPQILNVLRGDMSLIGPRPERPFFVERLTQAIPYYAERHLVRPGITGWAQVNYPYGASVDDARRKLSFDLFYVKNHSIFVDLQILLKTVRIILGSEGR
jgi:sugar transferase (PEP-CTERM system associated)